MGKAIQDFGQRILFELVKVAVVNILGVLVGKPRALNDSELASFE